MTVFRVVEFDCIKTELFSDVSKHKIWFRQDKDSLHLGTNV